MNSTNKIVLIGCGNVGYHLGKQLKTKGLNLIQVYSRSLEKAQKFAQEIGVNYTTDFQQIVEADLYILAVHDDGIGEVAVQLVQIAPHALMVHTSGATPSTVFQEHSRRFGVFYPLQTFSIHRKADFNKIPLCVDAAKPEDLVFLKKLAQQICPNVYHITDEQRAILHVAAVFVNNFTNHLFHVGEQIVVKENLDFNILKPLIQETVQKIMEHPPQSMQTGPAIRGDNQTIQRHLNYLEQYPDYQELYKIITKKIMM